MRFQAPMAAFLAFALALSCYPFAGDAFADETGFSGGHADNSPLLGGRSGSSGGLAGQAVAEGQEASASHSGYLPASGSGFAFAGDFLPAADYDDSRAVQADRLAGLNGRAGEDASADAEEQSEADSEGGEAAAEDPGRAEAEGLEAVSEKEGSLTSDENSDVHSRDFYASGGSVPADFSESEPDSSPDFGSLFIGGDSYESDFEYSEEFLATGSARAVPAVIAWAAAALGVASNASDIFSALNSIFGSSTSRTDQLLLSIFSYLTDIRHSLRNAINDNLGLIATRSLNIYELVREINNGNLGLIATRLLNVYNAVDGLEGSLSSVASRLLNIYNSLQSGLFSSDGSGNGLAAWVVLLRANFLNFANQYSSDFSNLYSRLGSISNLLWANDSSGTSISSWVVSLRNNLSLMNSKLDSYLYSSDGSGNGLAAWIVLFRANFQNFSSSLLALLDEYLSKLSSPSVSVEVGGDLLDKLLSGVNAIGSFLNPGAVVDGVTDVLGDLVEVPELADSLIGDLKFDSMDELASNIAAVVSGKFPFSIPFVFLGILTIFEAPSAPPVFEFDIAGSPMVIDFSEYGGFAELSRFFCSFFFAVSLLAVSRRFIFFGGASRAD